MAVRRATVDDAEAIERIRVETWRATYRGLLPDGLIDELQQNAERRRERLLSYAPSELTFVAEEGADVVGYALAARGMTAILIWVLRENTIGRGFYERIGGTAVRQKPFEEFPGAEEYVEIGYGWKDARPLLA